MNPLPDFFQKMLERKWLGDKTGGGFYKKVEPPQEKKTSGWRWIGRRWNTIRSRKPKFPALEMAKNVEQPGRDCECYWGWMITRHSKKDDKAGSFLWSAFGGSLELRGQPRAGDFGFHRGNRSRHAAGFQLGNGAI